ncbi:unnamed protein product [Zymoseptoria tritici ST99CH_1A5]|uniref:Uncharacterized protein n=1 Tax=Zymoseptoria tritici ST99CH_1A5 TaxID=1276529 RepID=A0A1Y6M0Q9_ZYMTR|nr:unnamed protein product [Zymoseptoria tritici ST99CH_1A5]
MTIAHFDDHLDLSWDIQWSSFCLKLIESPRKKDSHSSSPNHYHLNRPHQSLRRPPASELFTALIVLRTVSSKHARSMESLREEDEQPARKQTTSRHSRAEATPARASPAKYSPFSDQNVFEKSGGSPPAPQQSESER